MQTILNLENHVKVNFEAFFKSQVSATLASFAKSEQPWLSCFSDTSLNLCWEGDFLKIVLFYFSHFHAPNTDYNLMSQDESGVSTNEAFWQIIKRRAHFENCTNFKK